MARKKRNSGRNKGPAGVKPAASAIKEANSHYQKGSEFHQAGQLSLAESAYRRSISLNPTFPGSHNNLGNVLKDQSKYRLAEKAYQQALQLAPGHPMLLSNIGNVLYLQEKYAEAEEYLSRAIQQDPNHFDALVNLGNVLMASKRRDEAVRHYLKAFELRDSVPELLVNMGMVLSEESQYLPASQFLKKAVRLAPRVASNRSRLGYVLARIEQTDQAEQELSEAIRLAPEEPGIRIHYAEVLAQQGRVKKAIEQLQAVIALDDTFAGAYQLLAEYDSDAVDISTVKSLFQRKRVSKSEQKSLAFSLGWAYEGQRDYAQAFEWFAKANALSRGLADLPPYRLADSYKRIVDVFSSDPLSAPSDVGFLDETPIIIAGISRSGKSLVEKVLCCHGAVSPRGETGIFPRLIQELWSGREPYEFLDELPDLSADTLRTLGHQYVSQLRTDEEKQPHLTDTHPGNTMFVGLLRQCLPKAKIILCQRDARDACMMMYKANYLHQNHYSEVLRELGEYWSSHSRMLDLWGELFPDTVYQVSFEQLVESPEQEAHRLIEFCGLPDEPAYQDNVQELVTDPVRWPTAAKVIGVWKPYEAYLGPLFDALEGREH